MKKSIISILMVICITTIMYANGGQEAPSGSDSEQAVFEYPKKQLTIVVPGGAAGGMSINAQTIAKYLEKELGKPVTVENKPGAGGIVGATEFLLEKANSDKIIVLPSLVLAVAPLFQDVQYTEDDFIPIISINEEQNVVIANPAKTGINTFNDLQEFGKENVVKFGSGGPGAYNYLVEAALYKEMGIESATVPHKSAGEGVTNCLGGHVDITLASTQVAKSYLEDGSLKGLFVLSPGEYKYAGGLVVPSITEFGYDYNFQGYVYIAARKGTDPAIVQYLFEKIATVYNNPEFKAEMAKRETSLVLDAPGQVEVEMRHRVEDAKKFFSILENN